MVLAIVIATAVVAASAVAAFLLLRGSGPSYEEQIRLGERYYLDGDYEAAIVAYQKAIEIDPKQADSYLGLSNVYMKMGDYQTAMQIVETGLDAVTSEVGLNRLENQNTKVEQRKKRADREANRDEDSEDEPASNSGDADGQDDGTEWDERESADENGASQGEPGSNDSTSTGDSSDVLGNGSAVLFAEGYTYYWKYNSASYEQDGIHGNYGVALGSVNNLIRVSEDGLETVLYAGSGFGELYMYHNQLFFQCITDNKYEYHIFCLNLTDRSVTDYGTKEICALDDVRGKLIVANESAMTIIGLSDDSRFELPNATYLNLDHGILYYQDTSNSNTDAAKEGEVILCSIFTDGTNQKTLAKTPSGIYDWSQHIPCTITCTQIHENFIYFAYGFYAGSADYYQGGGLARVSIDGNDFSIISTSASDVFYIADQEANAKLYYYSIWINLSTGEHGVVESSPTSCETDGIAEQMPIGKPFKANDGFFYWHAPEDGHLELLASAEEISSLEPTRDNEESLITIRDVSAVGNQLYFTLDYGVHTPENDIGWRYSYRRQTSVFYRRTRGTDQPAEIVYSY